MFPGQLNFERRRPLGLFDESVKYEDALLRRRVVEHPEDAILALTRSSETPAATVGIGREFGIAIVSPHLQAEKTPAQPNPCFFRKLANHVPRLRMKDDWPHRYSCIKFETFMPAPTSSPANFDGPDRITG